MTQSDKTAEILAIDLGTSGPKVALVSTDGQVRACQIEKTTRRLLPDGGAEQDPNEWWRAIGRISWWGGGIGGGGGRRERFGTAGRRGGRRGKVGGVRMKGVG